MKKLLKTLSITFPVVILTLGTLALLDQSRIIAGDEDKNFQVEVDNTTIDRDSQFTPHSYANVLKQSTPAVVSVHTAKIVKVVQSGGSLSPEEEFLRRFFGLPVPRPKSGAQPDVEEKKYPQGIGSGVIIDKSGYVITNNHVVTDERGEDADEVLVRLNTGRELHAEIVGRDPRTDVAVLKIEADEDLPAINIADSDNIEVGDVVFAIGNPMGIGLTVTQGIVSATGRNIGIYGAEGYESFIQTDASINPGNSGGALIDSSGRLIGINSAILSRTGGNIGIGFAIPANLAVSITRHLINFGEVRRGFLGVNISDLTPDMAEAFGLGKTRGVLIDKVEKGYPADEAGIERGDVIVAIDGKPITSANDLRVKIGQTPPGTKLSMDVMRGEDSMIIEVSVGDRDGEFLSGGELFEGVAVKSLDDELRNTYRIPDDIDGLIITEVDSMSSMSRYLREGMVIIEINDESVNSLKEAKDSLRSGVNKLYVYDRGRIGYMAIRQ